MKIIIHNPNKKWKDGVTGKSKFVCRLMKALKKHGIEVTENDEPGDIALHIGRVRYKSKAKKNVLRLGPAHISTHENYRKLNKQKAKSLKGIDGVVYQSMFSRDICREFIGKPKCPETVIFNGADPDEFDVEPWPSDFEFNFLASTRKWLPQKRLKAIIDAFRDAGIKSSKLWICGDVMSHGVKTIKGDDIEVEYMGVVDPFTLARLYKLCNAMIHVVYLDACPNSVVESLIAKCPVICTNQGGTAELAAGNGWVIPDKPYRYEPINLLKPPKIDIMHLADVMWPRYSVGNIWHIHIDNIALQYIAFFARIL